MDIRQLLRIPEGYKIEKIDFNEEEINVKLRPYKRKLFVCSGCKEVHKNGYHSSEEIKVMDLPVVGRRVYLHVLKRKYRCPRDGKIYVEELDWAKKKEDIPIDLLKRFIV